MSFYNDNTEAFYLADRKENWTFKDYAKSVGSFLLLNATDEPVDIKNIPETDGGNEKHLVASQLLHAEIIEDSPDSNRVVYLLIFASGMQILINSERTEEDLLSNVEGFLFPPKHVSSPRAIKSSTRPPKKPETTAIVSELQFS